MMYSRFYLVEVLVIVILKKPVCCACRCVTALAYVDPYNIKRIANVTFVASGREGQLLYTV